MNIQILKILLWAKDQSKGHRELPFEPGKINIITGDSGTGKSTLTWIIDYCLGSEKCSIPVGHIRAKVEWFGLHIQVGSNEMVVARRNPGPFQATSELYFNEGASLTPPQQPTKNSTVDIFKSRLNQLAQLPTLSFAADDDATAYRERPGFRDMAAFNFQPQHIVANPYTLYFKADTTDHREKLKTIFPLVLGIINNKTLAQQHELAELEQAVARLRKELDSRQKAMNSWLSEVQAFHAHARELGLLPSTAAPDITWPLDRLIADLALIPATLSDTELPTLEQGSTERALEELSKIVNQEDVLARNIGVRRLQITKLTQLSFSTREYESELAKQRDRTIGIGWFTKKIASTTECPVCKSKHNSAASRLSELSKLAKQAESLTSTTQRMPAVLDKEISILHSDIRKLESELTETRRKRKELEDASQEMAIKRQRLSTIYRLAGRIEQALANIASIQSDGGLLERIAALEVRIRDLQKVLDPRTRRQQEEYVLDQIVQRVRQYAQKLNLERAQDKITLNIKELTLQFTSSSGRADFLWEIGSGQNWVGYHVATILALHEWFLTQPHSPVPSFAVFDQPSQVYFPEAWPEAENLPSTNTEQEFAKQSSDIAGVRRIFDALSLAISRTGGKFQIIVTEHAGQITWSGIEHTHLVENWRKDRNEPLIPLSW